VFTPWLYRVTFNPCLNRRRIGTYIHERRPGTFHKQFTSAVVETQGEALLINSALPREQVKALAEGLTLASQ
jgi:hypothetical protein